jgi:hypothetical protein
MSYAATKGETAMGENTQYVSISKPDDAGKGIVLLACVEWRIS